MAQQIANNPISPSPLASDMTAGQTTFVLSSGTSNYPASGNFQVQIDAEIMKVTGVSGSTYTVSRGQEGTTGAIHYAGTPVNIALTAAGLSAIVTDQFPGSIGDVFYNNGSSGATRSSSFNYNGATTTLSVPSITLGASGTLAHSSTTIIDASGNLKMATTTDTSVLVDKSGTIGESVYLTHDYTHGGLNASADQTSGLRGFKLTQSNSGIQGVLFQGRKSRGTLASPTAVAASDYGCVYLFQLHDGTNFLSSAGFGTHIPGSATITTGSTPQNIFFYNTGGTDNSDPYGTTSIIRMVINSLGNVVISNNGGDDSSGAQLQVAAGYVHALNFNADKYIQVGTGTADPTATSGDTIRAGSMFYNTSTNHLRLFNGSSWITVI